MTLAERLREQGREEGLAKGRRDTVVEVTLRLLRLKFGELPAAVTATIEAGSEADFERWTERVLVATSLSEVLDDSPVD